ncbi:MAG: YegP family protein [Vicinamibacterales bacterium]
MKKSQYTPRIYQDRRGQWRWTLLHQNGRKVATSGEGFARRCHAVQMVRRLFGPLLVLLALSACEASPPVPTSPSPAPAPPAATSRPLRPEVTPATARVTLTPDAGAAIVATLDDGGPVLSVPITVTGGGQLCAEADGYEPQCVRVVLPLEAGALPPPIVLVRKVPGCIGGLLLDPKAYVFSVLGVQEGQPAGDWEARFHASGLRPGPAAHVKPDFSVHYGISSQWGEAGHPKPRIFLPTSEPDDIGYYARPVDILNDLAGVPRECERSADRCRWEWRDREPVTTNAPAYAAARCP